MKKNTLMVALFGLGALGVVGTASAANEASQVFTWSGTVPAASTQGTWIIKSPQAGDVGTGILVFKADAAGKGVLTGSSDLAFNVFEYDDQTSVVGVPAKSYAFQLSSIGVSSNGLVAEQGANGYFAIQGDGAALVKGTDVTKSTGGDTVLTVAPTSVGTPSNQPAAGDDVNIQAAIVITSAASV